MASRRSGLGAIKAVHTAAAEAANERVRMNLNEAADALKKGNCNRAVGALLTAYENHGAVIAHSRESGGKMPWHPQGVWSQIEPKIRESCVVAEKVDVGGWSPPMAGLRLSRKRSRR